MKKIIFALVVLLSVQFANAQVKPAATAKKAVESAQAASQDPKKATKVATWLKLSKSYIDAYNSPKGNAMNMLGIGVGQQEVALQLAGEKPVSVENIVIGGQPYIKEVYETRDYLYNSKGQFEMIVVKKTVVENALAGALEAYKKAYEVDAKQSKLKDIKEGIAAVVAGYLEDGMTAYTLGDNATASKYFGLAGEASLVAPCDTPNAEAFYYAGYTALVGGNTEQARVFFEKCLELNYYENGEVYAKLAAIYEQYAKAEETKAAEIENNTLLNLEMRLSYAEGQLNDFVSKEKVLKLNEEDLAARMGKKPRKEDVAMKQQFASQRRAALDSIAKFKAEIETVRPEFEKLSKIVAEYNEAGMKQREISRGILEQGFEKFPQSQSVLIGLINCYLESKQDPSRLFELIAAAKVNEPTNASLCYVEGNIYNELRQAVKEDTPEAEAKRQEYFDCALKAYEECVKVNPEFEYGYIGKGLLYYNYAAELKDKANFEESVAKYEELDAKSQQAYLDSMEPFEQAFAVTKDAILKKNIADFLKSIYYRFSSEEKYLELYKKYDAIVKEL